MRPLQEPRRREYGGSYETVKRFVRQRSGFTRVDLREQAPNRYRWAEAPDSIDKRLPASDTYDDTRRDPASNETRPLITESTESLGRDSRRHARREPNVDAST